MRTMIYKLFHFSDEERKRNMKVSFGLKTKLKPVNKTTSKIQATAVFNQNEEEDEESVKTDGFKPNKGCFFVLLKILFVKTHRANNFQTC